MVLISCAKRNSSWLTQLQTEKITGFFEELLLEHGGAYTLFGTKPITIEDLYSEEDLQKITLFLKERPEIEAIFVERQLEEGWEEYKKICSNISSENYILTEIKSADSRLLIFVNISQTINMFNQYRSDFLEVLEYDFVPERLIEALREKKYEDWGKIICNSKTLGILAGYGYRNAGLFSTKLPTSFQPSENNDPRLPAECILNKKPFRIPIFVIIDEEESRLLISKYKRERELIKKNYANRDFLQTTLSQIYGNKSKEVLLNSDPP